MDGGKGFKELQRQANGISAKVLSESLEDLREKGLVEKTSVSPDTRRAEYKLTEKGGSLKPVIISMKDWGEDNRDRI